MHDAEYKSISLQKEEEWQRTQVTITASLFRTRIPPSSGTLSVLNSHLGWNSNHYHWWQQQLRICRFFSFSGKRQKNTEILFTKEGKGAGYARNIGLSHARGKWIIFADADDFFTADCFTILNEYMDSPHEVIYFNVRFVMSDNPSQESRRGTYYTNFFNDVNPENKLRYQSQVPWGKMIRRSFLSTFHIQFDETRIANDVYFHALSVYMPPKQPQTEESFIIVPNPASPLLCPNKTARV